jgi:hypothetical protein
MVSKKAIYNLIQKYYPITELIKEGQQEIKTTIEQAFIQYPFFVKPDGLRGSGVKKINGTRVRAICDKGKFDFLVQDLIPFQNEVGIFTFVIQMKKRKKQVLFLRI